MNTIGLASPYASDVRYDGTEKTTAKARDAYASSSAGKDKKGEIVSGRDDVIDNRPSAAAVNFQSRLAALHPTSVSSALKGKPMWEMPGDFFERILSSRQTLLEANYTRFPEAPDLSDYAGIKPYATIVVGGEVMATVDNQGVVSTDDALGRKLRSLLKDVEGANGPDLAQTRADQIAEFLGGRVVKSDTALTQVEFSALPKIEDQDPWIDYDAMRADPEYSLIQDMMQRRSEYLAYQ